MSKLDALMQTAEIQNAIDALCEAQDAALMQVMAIADLAKGALWSDAEDAELGRIRLDSLLSAVAGIAGAAIAKLDTAQIAISDARIRGSVARAGA